MVGRTNTYDILQIVPCYSVEVFIFHSQQFTVNGSEREGRIVIVNLIYFLCYITHFGDWAWMVATQRDEKESEGPCSFNDTWSVGFQRDASSWETAFDRSILERQWKTRRGQSGIVLFLVHPSFGEL
jgi:hypothetical protein